MSGGDAREVHLRASLVWRDEVMGDVVLTRPGELTIGTGPRCTFVVPDLGLPATFAVIKPGNRGYLLTLGQRMRGTIHVDGAARDVEEFVRRGGEGELGVGFRATAIGGRDWGVVDLDESGDHKLFFQFVPVEAVPRAPAGRYREILAIAAVILAGALAFPTYATLILLAAMGGTALFQLVLGFIQADEDDFTRPAIAFSILLFALLIGVAHQLGSKEHPWVPPGPSELTAGYLVERLGEPPPPPPEPEPVKGPASDQPAAAADGDAPKVRSATRGDEGASGGKGDKRARDPDVDDGPPPPPDRGVFTGRNRKQFDRIAALDNLPALDRYGGLKGPPTPGDAGMGKGTGSGVGDELGGSGTRRDGRGKGRGGGGSAEGDFQSSGPVDPGDKRTPRGTGGTGSGVKEAQLKFDNPGGDFTGGLSREDVDRVVKSRRGTIHACYQREVNRDKSLAGKLTVSFVINAAGDVTSVRIDPGKSDLRNAAVESCVKRQVQGMKFPAKGGATVNYPFIFSQG